jgi:hypothetical protein
MVEMKRSRIRLRAVADVRRELGKIYKEGKTGKRDVREVSQLANLLAILGRLMMEGDIEKRLEALEQRFGK